MLLGILFSLGFWLVGALAWLFCLTHWQAILLTAVHVVVSLLCALVTYRVVSRNLHKEGQEAIRCAVAKSAIEAQEDWLRKYGEREVVRHE